MKTKIPLKIFNPSSFLKHDLITYKVLLLLINDYSAPEMLKILNKIPIAVRGHRIARALIELKNMKIIETIDFERYNFKYSTLIYTLSDNVKIKDSALELEDVLEIQNIYKLMLLLSFEFTNEIQLKYNDILYRKIKNFCNINNQYVTEIKKRAKIYNFRNRSPGPRMIGEYILIRKV